MQNEEPLSFDFAGVPAYDFTVEEATNTIYAFVTVNGVFYEVRFKPSGYVFADYSWKDTVFEIIIDLVFAPDPEKIPADRSIQATIINIVADFFRVNERVILYICDDSDSRELARKRKFDTWYARYGTRLFIKYDLPRSLIAPSVFLPLFSVGEIIPIDFLLLMHLTVCLWVKSKEGRG